MCLFFFSVSTTKKPISVPLRMSDGSTIWINICYIMDTRNHAITISFDYNVILINALPLTVTFLLNNCDKDVLEGIYTCIHTYIHRFAHIYMRVYM